MGAIIAAVALVVTVVTVWAERHPLDADRFAAAAAVALEDPEVVAALAVVVTDQVVDLVLAVVDPRQLLPGPLQDLGGGFERWVRDQLAGQVAVLIGTDTVSGWIVDSVRSAHDDVLELMRDGRTSDGLLVSGSDSVRLDLTALLAIALDALADRSLLPGMFRDLQDSLRGGLDGLRQRVLDVTGIDIGADIGTLPVYDDAAVDGGGWALRSSRTLAGLAWPGFVVPLSGLGAAVGAMVLSRDRRRPLEPFGIALVATAAAAAVYVWRLGLDIEHLLVEPAARRAVASIVDVLVRPLHVALAVVAVAGIGLAVGSRWPDRSRPPRAPELS